MLATICERRPSANHLLKPHIARVAEWRPEVGFDVTPVQLQAILLAYAKMKQVQTPHPKPPPTLQKAASASTSTVVAEELPDSDAEMTEEGAKRRKSALPGTAAFVNQRIQQVA